MDKIAQNFFFFLQNNGKLHNTRSKKIAIKKLYFYLYCIEAKTVDFKHNFWYNEIYDILHKYALLTGLSKGLRQ